MDKRRTIVISIAVLLAVIAGGAVFLFLKDSSDSSTAVEGQKSALVAARALPASTRASQIVDTGGFKIVNQPESNVPNDAILTLEQLNAIASEGKVLISAVPETTVLRASSFGAPGDSISSVNGALAADEQLITIPSASIRGSAQVFLSLATTSTGSSQLWRPAAPQPRQAGLRRPPLPVPQVLPRRGISSRISKSMPSDRQQQRRLQAPSHQPVQQPRHLPRVQKLHSASTSSRRPS